MFPLPFLPLLYLPLSFLHPFSHAPRIPLTHTPGPHHPTLPSPRPVILRTKTTWDGLLGYLHTFSSLHTFHEKYPHDLAHPDGDISVRFWKALQDVVRREKGEVGEHVMVEWPLALILGKVA